MCYKFKFSVIMPLYNVEEYFEEAIESVILQTIGFEENIQIILVNDGSPDNVELLCLKYTKMFPENIFYVKKENGGVSSARNEGMKYIQGKYVNFFDADDKWDLDAFKLGYRFLETHHDVDVVSCRYSLFGKREGYVHPLDYKYSRESIIDIRAEYTYVQMAVNAVFIRATALEGHFFDTRLKISEDSIFISKVICELGKYGILPNAVYYYRKRLSNDSAIDFSTKSRTWYFDTPEYCYKELFLYSKSRYGEILPYFQYLVMYDLQWRLKTEIPKDFTNQDINKYKDTIVELLKCIDDKIIWKQKNISYIYKFFALELKYGERVLEHVEQKKHYLIYKGIKVFNLRAIKRFRINICEINKGNLELSGITSLAYLGDLCKIFVKDNKKRYYPIDLSEPATKNIIEFTGQEVLRTAWFSLSLPLEPGCSFKFIAVINGQEIVLNPSFGDFGKFNHKLPHSYFVGQGYLIKYEKNRLKCFRQKWKTHMASELRYMHDLFCSKKIKFIFYRCVYYVSKLFNRKPKWIISDRTFVAGDNGEALFRYIMERKMDKGISYCFTISKNSPDFKRLKKIGKIVPFGTLQYKLDFLRCDKVISSHADEWVTNPFGAEREYLKDLFCFDFIFLQHGIIQSDLSSWLHKQKKNIKLFVTSSLREKCSIVDGNYGYSEKEVQLLGLPRHDLLCSERNKTIIFLPTWRKNIAESADINNGVRPYAARFKETEYFTFYNRLINDARILKTMQKNGYTGEFYVHPSFQAHTEDFEGNDVITVGHKIASYNEIFRKADLLITDYSSVAFDFAALKKPIIYSQFDYDVFYNIHISQKGYFSYDRDGFGPVCYDYESTVETIINEINSGCIMGKQYVKRVDDFFEYKDQGNCERVYQAIQDMDRV